MKMYSSSPLLLIIDCTNPFSLEATNFASYAAPHKINSPWQLQGLLKILGLLLWFPSPSFKKITRGISSVHSLGLLSKDMSIGEDEGVDYNGFFS